MATSNDGAGLRGTRRRFLSGVAVIAGAHLLPPAALAADARSSSILIIGHADHGKTTLGIGVTKVQADRGMARFVPYESMRPQGDGGRMPPQDRSRQAGNGAAALRARRLSKSR